MVNPEKIILDLNEKSIEINGKGAVESLPLYSKESLELLSDIWIKVQWNEFSYQTLSWLGLPILQLSEDLMRLQEVICDLVPDVIIETGVFKGGSAVFFASICRAFGKGKVISVDIQIPDEVRKSIENSPVGKYITLIEGDSSSAEVFENVRSRVLPGQKVFVFLDSDHSKAHVAKELEMYSQLISPGSYIVACDGVMEKLCNVPNGDLSWLENNPAAAVRDFLANHPKFKMARPAAKFNNNLIVDNLTYWPGGWLKRIT